jgi:hypothetical protein
MGTAFAEELMIRFAPSREAVEAWHYYGGAAILVIDPSNLQAGDWIEVRVGDRHVRAAVVLEHGQLWEPSDSTTENQ